VESLHLRAPHVQEPAACCEQDNTRSQIARQEMISADTSTEVREGALIELDLELEPGRPGSGARPLRQ
jgi:hypothetical protein